MNQLMILYGRHVGHVLSDVHSPGSGPIWWDDLACTDSCHTGLNDCSHGGWGKHDCDHNEDVSIACYDRTTTPEPMTTRPTAVTEHSKTQLVKGSTSLRCCESLLSY